MVVIIPDNKKRIVKLTGDEIQMIIEALEVQPYNLYKFLNTDKIIKELKKARDNPQKNNSSTRS